MDHPHDSSCPDLLTPSWRALEETVLAYERDFAEGTLRPVEEYLPADRSSVRRAMKSELMKVRGQLEHRRVQTAAAGQLGVGETLGDFQLVELLAEGAFAQIYRARQVSMSRDVALKITASSRGEAQVLAGLDHDNIVRVYADVPLQDRGLHALCMQYVPGTTLAQVLQRLGARELDRDSDSSFFMAVGALSHTSPQDSARPLDWSGLRHADLIESTAWVGERLAAALAVVHARGILHCDVKPQNILVTPQGRPLLTDFNLSIVQHGITADGVVGGTLAYMSPEHLDAFRRPSDAARAGVNHRSDLYSLGVVLFEMATGRRPFDDQAESAEFDSQCLAAMSQQRRRGAVAPRAVNPSVSIALDQVIQRALKPEPGQRFRSARAMSAALEGARTLRRVDKSLPRAGGLADIFIRYPFACLDILGVLPHILAAVVLVVYQLSQVTPRLTAHQQALWQVLTGAMFCLAVPAVLACYFSTCVPLRRVWRQLMRGELISASRSAAARRRIVALPMLGVALAAVSWNGGELIVLGGLALLTELPAQAAWHHFASFALASLIAVTYSYFIEEFLAIRILYPQMWSDPTGVQEVARGQLRRVGLRLRLFQVLAGAIPLAGAAMIVLFGPSTAFVGAQLMQKLALALILLGMLGFGLSVLAAHWLTQTVYLFSGASPQQVVILPPGNSR